MFLELKVKPKLIMNATVIDVVSAKEVRSYVYPFTVGSSVE